MCHSRTRLRPQTTRRAAPLLKPPGPSLPGRGGESFRPWSRLLLARPGLALVRELSSFPCLLLLLLLASSWRWGGVGARSELPQATQVPGLAGLQGLPPAGTPSPPPPSPFAQALPTLAGPSFCLCPLSSPLGWALLPAAANLCLSSRGSSEPNVSEGTSLSAPRPSKSLPCAN